MEKIPAVMLNAEAERYFGALFEHIDGKLDHILEVMPLLDKRAGSLEVRMDLIERRLDELENTQYILGKSVDELTAEVKGMRKELHAVSDNQSLSALARRIIKIERALAR